MARFNITSVQVNNYRTFSFFEIEGFKQLNIIGGLNGAGKSTLLEAIFTVLDRTNPSGVFRPFNWRLSDYHAGDLEESFNQTIFKGASERAFSVTLGTTIGEFSVLYKQGLSSQSLPSTSINVGGDRVSKESMGTYRGPTGYTLSGTHNSAHDLQFNVQYQAGGIAAQAIRVPTTPIPKSSFLNALTRRNAMENIVRHTSVVRDNRLPQVVEMLKIIHPEISGLQVLSTSGHLDLHAKLSDGLWVPTAFLGEGAATLIAVALTMYDCRGGTVMLDEFDTTIHHSLLPNVWSAIFRFAHAWDVQIFCTTHSLESVRSASAAAAANQKYNLTYTRLQRSDDGFSHPSIYDKERLGWALEDSWEVR